MNKEKEKQYREEFEARDIFKNCPWLLEKNQNEQYESCIVQGEFDGYLAGRKKGDEEIEMIKLKACDELSRLIISNSEAQKEIAQLKEQLKREAECVDFYSDDGGRDSEDIDGVEKNMFGMTVVVAKGGKRAREVKAQRGKV